jgi:hypothetical protein
MFELHKKEISATLIPFLQGLAQKFLNQKYW